eukprot:TRINITY_DN12318_c0_g1_i2.p1 TRINITY_DN12318_c0_g1~~TRINITY_DN12318_c0_g1_i2.p1  ORF type:complete len:329 (+),score=54.33 TRINITY_DN12318_c0_g1_i2:78-1064(+)
MSLGWVIENSPEKGNYIEASKKFNTGECIINNEEPLGWALQSQSQQMCHYCLSQTKNKTLRCGSCKWFRYCSKRCQKESWRRGHKDICGSVKLKPSQAILPPSVSICLQLLKSDELDYICNKMVHHEDYLSSEQALNIAELANLVFSLLPEDIEETERRRVFRLLNVINCNSCSLTDSYYETIGLGIYKNISLINHSCKPNCVLLSNGRKQSVIAIEKIMEGEEITINYCDNSLPRLLRQKHLQEDYFFKCNCTLCSDNDHLNNHIVLNCPSCAENKKAGEIIVDWSGESDEKIDFESNKIRMSCKTCGIPSPLQEKTLLEELISIEK